MWGLGFRGLGGGFRAEGFHLPVPIIAQGIAPCNLPPATCPLQGHCTDIPPFPTAAPCLFLIMRVRSEAHAPEDRASGRSFGRRGGGAVVYVVGCGVQGVECGV